MSHESNFAFSDCIQSPLEKWDGNRSHGFNFLIRPLLHPDHKSKSIPLVTNGVTKKNSVSSSMLLNKSSKIETVIHKQMNVVVFQ
jgi:hypothetical protein